MNTRIVGMLLALVLLTAASRSAAADPLVQETPPPVAKQPAWTDKLYFGGGVGASFGDVDYVELSPLVGYQLNSRISFGTGAFYRWTSDARYSPSVDTSDYGANVFSRINVVRPFYAHIEYEFVNYEYPTFAGSTDRSRDSNILVGGGFFQPMGGRGGIYATALYDLSYDSNNLNSPYDSPWVYRIGFTLGF